MAAYAIRGCVGSMTIFEHVRWELRKIPAGPVLNVQEVPPSVDTRMPSPKFESAELLASPVPA
jgi:hypothetical protein